MNELLTRLTAGVALTGNVRIDVPAFLMAHGYPKTVGHSAGVALEARRIAALVGQDGDQATTAGWLHDISVVFPDETRVEVARILGVEVLAAEETYPMIIHQKLSVVLAREIFGVSDKAVLSAIGCHTTLKAGASRLDQVVFVADKIAWDQPGKPPYLDDLLAALERSLAEAAFVYLNYLWERRETLRVIHPWLVEAYEEMKPGM